MIPRSPFWGKIQLFVHFALVFCFLTVLHNRRSISSNILVFHSSGNISSKSAAFLLESNGLLTWWSHRLFWHFRWSFTRRCIGDIFVYNLLRQHTSNVNGSNKNIFTLKRQEADYIPRQLWLTQTTLMIQRFSEIQSTKPNPYSKARGKQ